MSKPSSVTTWIKENKLLSGLGFILILWIFISFTSTTDSNQVIQNSFTNTSTTSESTSRDVMQVSIGELADIGNYTFSIIDFEEMNTLTDWRGNITAAKEDAKFIVVELEVVNQTIEEFYFSPDRNLRIYDDRGRQFETYNDTIGSIENYLNVRDLGPGIKEVGVIVYEVPEDVLDYALVAEGSDGKLYSSVLKKYEE